MSKEQFEALQVGDVVANELGWEFRIVRRLRSHYQGRSIPNTGIKQELRSSAKHTAIRAPHAWRLVSSAAAACRSEES